jgi:hypothetical protein
MRSLGHNGSSRTGCRASGDAFAGSEVMPDIPNGLDAGAPLPQAGPGERPYGNFTRRRYKRPAGRCLRRTNTRRTNTRHSVLRVRFAAER